MQKLIQKASLLVLVLAFLAMALPVGSVNATQEDYENRKVTICHRTRDVKKPYVKIEVNINSVDGEGGEGDHYANHTGPIAKSEEHAQQLKDDGKRWGDIIPPVEGIHNGLNWDWRGKAMWKNDCNYLIKVKAEPVIFTAATCEVKGSYTIPEVEGVDYLVDEEVVAAGTYSVDNDATVKVTIKAQPGYKIHHDSEREWSYTFTAPTDCDEEEEPQVLAQVTTTPTGAVDAGAGAAGLVANPFAIFGLGASSLVTAAGVALKKFGL
jgi:hypothetical protein